MSNDRKKSGFLINQRAFLKLYLISNIENGRWYGMQLTDKLKDEFKHLGYIPKHPEVYRALKELMDEGILKRGTLKKEDSHFQEITLYYIRDLEKALEYKKKMKLELERCEQLLKKALLDIYP